jgi:metal-responsive CopG/Arc/MetJ family transcriptional regulator
MRTKPTKAKPLMTAISVTIDNTLLPKLKARAEELDVTVSQYIRRAVRHQLAKDGTTTGPIITHAA